MFQLVHNKDAEFVNGFLSGGSFKLSITNNNCQTLAITIYH